MPLGHPHQQRPLGEPLVLVEVFQRVAGEEVPLALGEKLLQAQVDRPHRAVEIDRAEQVRPDGEEPHQGREPPLVDRQPRGR